MLNKIVKGAVPSSELGRRMVVLQLDVVASDSHDTTKRPNDMKSAYESVENYYSESLARQLFVTMPATLLQKYVVKPLAR